MKWKNNTPRLNEKRSIVKFALVPVLIKDQWVWLERYVSNQVYQVRPYHHSGLRYTAFWYESSKELYDKKD